MNISRYGRSVPARAALLLLAALLVVPLARERATAQYLPNYVMRGIDSTLASILMTRSDLMMRWDRVADDPHRLNTIKELFGDPLRSIALADTIGSAAEKSFDEPAVIFKQLQRMLDIDGDILGNNRPPVTDKEIKFFSKIDMDSMDFTPALILRRFLILTLATDVQVYNNRSLLADDQYSRLVEYSDSLLLESEENAEASPVELRMAERYGIARSKQYFNIDANHLDHAQFLTPGVSMFVTALDYARSITKGIESFRDSVKTRIWNTRLGKIAIGGPGDDLYTGDFYCIIDVGGNDIYRPKKRTKQEAAARSVTMIIDFQGDDTYLGHDYDFGGTLFGASTVIDLKGNDSYSAGNFALGSGYFGVGILYDAEGSDRYSGGTCVEGAGLFGIGMIIDGKGNDSYMAHLQSQGFGFTRGAGGIIDREGNDTYIAASPYTDYLRYDDHYNTFSQGTALGMRPVASGGYGFIADISGNDTYSADIYGQGSAYWYGFGAVIDRKGSDNYNAFQYAQGAGVHYAFGVLLDNAGNDNYVSHGVSQGCGHDVGFGGLYDVKGDDNYVVESLSLGGGNANAISLFVDGAGADGYISRQMNTLGYSDLRNWYGMIGLFLDLEGSDFYGTPRGRNDTTWTGSFYGAGIDANFRPKDLDVGTPEPKEPAKTKEEIDRVLAKDIPSLFIQASTAPQKYQYMVEPARERLISRADESIPYLLSMLNSESARERNALGFILPKFGPRIVPMLIDTVLKGDPERRGLAMYVLGEMHDSTAAIALGRRLTDTSSWRMKASAAEALLKMRADSARPYLRRALKDTVEIVRARVARALVNIADSAELTMILPLLNDPSQIVRYQIQIGLQYRPIDSIDGFVTEALLANRSGYPHNLLYPLAGKITDPELRKRLVETMLADEAPAIRAEGARLAIEWRDEPSLAKVAKLRKNENSSLVLYEIYRAGDLQKELKDEQVKKKKEKKEEHQADEEDSSSKSERKKKRRNG